MKALEMPPDKSVKKILAAALASADVLDGVVLLCVDKNGDDAWVFGSKNIGPEMKAMLKHMFDKWCDSF